MNYQLLIESYTLGSSLSEQEIELLSLELETQIMNINISTEFGFFKSAPSHICEGLNLKKDTYWICLLYTSPSPRDRTRSRMPSSA